MDAWALDNNNRQINTEMQNDTKHDDVRKRSRYYQGLLDSPILKSGKQTLYKNLPSTVIIFITQEDIWGKEKPELVSLLQYMKETRLDNPEILVKDRRILKLDSIVKEVKQSEEWEAVKMNILEIGIEQGKVEGLILAYRDMKLSDDEIMLKLVEKFDLTPQDAKKILEKNR